MEKEDRGRTEEIRLRVTAGAGRARPGRRLQPHDEVVLVFADAARSKAGAPAHRCAPRRAAFLYRGRRQGAETRRCLTSPWARRASVCCTSSWRMMVTPCGAWIPKRTRRPT